MSVPEDDGLVRCVAGFLAEREAMAAREKKMVDDLNAVLGKMGYRVVPTNGSSDGAPTGRKRGRPPGPGRARETRPQRPPE